MSIRGFAFLAAGLLAVACAPRAEDRASRAAVPAPCPAEAPAQPLLPFEAPEHSLAEFWLTAGGASAQLEVPGKRTAEHNQRMHSLSEQGWPVARWQLEQLQLEPDRVRARLQDRLERFAQGVRRGERVLAGGAPAAALLEELRSEIATAGQADEIRVALRSTAMRCFPTEAAVYEKPWDLAFDLMQCAQLRFGEPVRVAAKGHRLWYVWSTFTDGWVRPADLTPPLSPEQARGYLHPERFVVMQQDRVAIWADAERRALLGAASLGTRLPLLGTEGTLQVQAPAPAGLVSGFVLPRLDAPVGTEVSIGYPRLTRAALVDRAFRLLHTPYGWGGSGDKRDCSGLMMDLFAAFGLEIPRNTTHQALAGTRQVDVAKLSEPAKAQAIENEARRGLVLLYLPGHIMLFMGRDGGQLYAYHLFSGYLTPCAPRGETMQRVNRTVVTSLELGRGGSRRAFIQRITKLIVFDGAVP